MGAQGEDFQGLCVQEKRENKWDGGFVVPEDVSQVI